MGRHDRLHQHLGQLQRAMGGPGAINPDPRMEMQFNMLFKRKLAAEAVILVRDAQHLSCTSKYLVVFTSILLTLYYSLKVCVFFLITFCGQNGGRIVVSVTYFNVGIELKLNTRFNQKLVAEAVILDIPYRTFHYYTCALYTTVRCDFD